MIYMEFVINWYQILWNSGPSRFSFLTVVNFGLALDNADTNIRYLHNLEVTSSSLRKGSYFSRVKAYVTLYGDMNAMEEISPIIGQKFVWCKAGSTCEFHGKEKKS